MSSNPDLALLQLQFDINMQRARLALEVFCAQSNAGSTKILTAEEVRAVVDTVLKFEVVDE